MLLEAAHAARRRARPADRRPRPRRRRASATVDPLGGHRRSSWCPPTRPSELDDVLARAPTCSSCPSVMRESHSLVTREALLRGRAGGRHRHASVPRRSSTTAERPRRARRRPAPAAPPPCGALVDPAVLDAPAAGGAATAPDGAVGRRPGRRASRRAYAAARSPSPAAAGPPTRARPRCCSWSASTARRCATAPTCPAEALALHGVHSDVRHYRDPDVAAPRGSGRRGGRLPGARHPQVLDADRRRARSAGTPVRVRRRRPDLRPGDRRRDPRPAPAPAGRGRAVARGRAPLPHHDGGLRRLHRLDPGLVEHARRVVGIDAHLFENGVGVAIGVAERHRAPSAALARAAPGRLLQRHHHPRRRLATHRAQRRRGPGRPPGRRAVAGRPPAPDRGASSAGSATGSVGCRSRLASTCPALLRDLDVNLAPLEPGSRFNDAKSAIKWLEAALVGDADHRQPVGTVPRRHRRRPHRVARRRPGGLGSDASTVPSTTATSATSVGARARRAALLRWSPHRQGDRYLEILAQVRAQPEQPSAPRGRRGRRLRRTPRCPLRTRLEAYPVPIEGSIGWRVRRIPRPTLLRRLRTKVGAVRRSVVEDGAARHPRARGRAARRVVERPGRDGVAVRATSAVPQHVERRSGAVPEEPSVPPALKAPTTGTW